MTITDDPATLTIEDLPQLLERDDNVKVAACDIDGILRGKLMSKKKFLSIASEGFGFCAVVFRWDMHDQTYPETLDLPNRDPSDRDLLARIDLTSFRRIPWENNMPFFMCNFNTAEGASLSICPRSLLARTSEAVEEAGFTAMAGAEYEFFQFRVPRTEGDQTTNVVKFLQDNPIKDLPPLTEGMFGYSLTRPIINQDYYYDVVETCRKFSCPIEGWHCESGPGVYEAALEYDEIKAMADKAALFKLTVKTLGSKYGITPCFMAKPRSDLPGNSGHIHVSLTDSKTKQNLFARDSPDESAPYEDLKHVSDLGRCFLAGILDGLPDVMPILAPTINSYKRLVENFFAPTTVSWALEHRAASIRLIAPPIASPKSTRFEVRVPGADTNPYLVLATVLALGWRGVEKKLEIKLPPIDRYAKVVQTSPDTRLAKDLRAANDRFRHPSSVARELFGNDFVDHFAATREHEVKLFEQAVTDWEMRRYIENV